MSQLNATASLMTAVRPSPRQATIAGSTGTLVDGLYAPPARLSAPQALATRATDAARGSAADVLLILAP